MPIAHLPERSIVHVSGADASPFLQGLITNDMERLNNQPALFAAMLSPQGKFLFDMFITRDADKSGYLIDIDHSFKERFIKALKMYKLRAQVTIEDKSDTYHVCAGWECARPEHGYSDPRHDALGWRMIGTLAPSPEDGTAAHYDAHRLALAIPDGARDAGDRSFVMDMGYDVLHGISFTKGCYVGQEVTARMHYKSVMRKALYQVTVQHDEATLPDFGAPIVAGEVQLGEMRSHAGRVGLAMMTIDKADAAVQTATPVLAGDAPVGICMAPWLDEKWQRIQALDEKS